MLLHVGSRAEQALLFAGPQPEAHRAEAPSDPWGRVLPRPTQIPFRRLPAKAQAKRQLLRPPKTSESFRLTHAARETGQTGPRRARLAPVRRTPPRVRHRCSDGIALRCALEFLAAAPSRRIFP